MADEKRDLQIELLKLQIYKSKLECRKIEMELGLPRSSYTSSIEESIMVVVGQPIVIDNANVVVDNNATIV